MTFGEKLKAIRKEKGYSQEEMAGLLDVSRQAVSKWESDRGIPEINKLLQISNMFGVTLDYLLKSDNQEGNNQSGGYYVSRETIEGFLSYKRHRAKNIAIGVGLIIGSDIFGSFSDYRQLLLPLYWGTMAIGIAILVWTFFLPKHYQEICSNSLLFDEEVIKSFREDSSRNRKRYAGMIVLSVVLFFFGSEFIFMAKDIVGSEVCNALDWLIDAAAVMLLIMASMSIHAENIIAQNTEYIHKKNSRGKFAWFYVALPATVLAVVMGIMTAVGLAGCGADRDDRGKDLPGLSQIEVYSSDGHLVNTILDGEILGKFDDLNYTEISSDTDEEMDALESKIGDLNVICTIISYKTPVAAYHDGSLEKLMELTVYEDSNIIKEQISPETIKGEFVPEEFLTFYVTVSDEDKNFILSLME